MNAAQTTRRFLDPRRGGMKYSAALPVALLPAVACRDATRPVTQAATDDRCVAGR